MYSGFKYKGDVGHVIEGNATFSAPCTFNQTTHVTMTPSSNDDRPLLLHQRFEIAARIDALAELKGVPSEAIARAVLREYGPYLQIGDLQQRHYRDVVADLEAWLEQVRRPQRMRQAAKRYRRRRAAYKPAVPLWRWMAPLAASIGALVASLCTALADADQPPSQCFLQGATYSVGAIAPMHTNDVYECTFDPSAHPAPYWAPARNLGGAGVPHT
ncbi:hypothetical protein [Ralstonia pseudosolanacearum]|uniref:hypothetical protein n=1 Tax=Ralstonia pseudosolanacearum TaxID=1310165 RepID=UPI0019101383|nr:hypothetical protein RPSD_04170 [Ralstonia solanacearum]